MGTGLAVVLNLDADVELAARGRYEPTRRTLAAMKPHVERLRREWLSRDDLQVDESTPPGLARGRRGLAFSPTPRALALLERAGAELPAHPDLEVLRRVNSRRFSSALGETLPSSVFATSLEEALSHLALDPVISTRFRLKRAFGMSGRGHRVVEAGAPPAADLVAFLRGAMQEGGLRIEPDVPIEREHGLHGLLSPDGALELGAVVTSRSDARGAWLSTERSEPASVAEIEEALRDEAVRVARALHDAAYFGPFGIDSFVYRDPGGVPRLVARSEINARYSMGFLVGFGRLL